MPLTLNVGLSRKMGLPNYGSLGASCSLEVELPSAVLVNDLEGFQRQVRNAYAACAQAVKEELARQQQPPSPEKCVAPTRSAANDNGNGCSAENSPEANGNGKGKGPAHESPGVSDRQLDYIRQLAGQIKGLGLRRLEAVTAKMFGKPLAGISAVEASALITVLTDVRAGKIGLKAAIKERSDEAH